jgi:hypothetical protein
MKRQRPRHQKTGLKFERTLRRGNNLKIVIPEKQKKRRRTKILILHACVEKRAKKGYIFIVNQGGLNTKRSPIVFF